LVLTDVADVGSAVGEDKRGNACVFFGAAVAMGAAAVDVANGDAGGIEEEVGGDFGAGR
jgi:hypothetical protein